MFTKRIIPCLDVHGGRVVKGVNFVNLRDAENVLLVSHGSACRIIRSYFVEMTDEEFYAYSQPNGSIVEYEFR